MSDESPLTQDDAGTVSREIARTPTLTDDATTLASVTLPELTEQIGDLNNRARVVHEDTDDLHLDALILEWQAKTNDLVRQDVPSLLGHLARLGFAWRDIARLIGVSVPAVQKWRRGGTATGTSRSAAAAILAACDLITEHYLVQDVASWFETPIIFGYPVTALDLYAAKRVPLVFRLATGKADPEAVLSAFDPEWREHYRSDFEVFSTDDGLAIRAKES